MNIREGAYGLETKLVMGTAQKSDFQGHPPRRAALGAAADGMGSDCDRKIRAETQPYVAAAVGEPAYLTPGAGIPEGFC